MKAITFRKYGGPEVLQLETVEVPPIGDNEVLIKVRAVSINSWDYELLRGIPLANRFMFGLTRPKKINILGSDIAGIVEKVGPRVTRFKIGDEVLGDQTTGHWGGFAEYSRAAESNLILKPAEVSFEEAACIPQAGLLAMQALCDYAQIKAGRHCVH